MNKNNLSYWFPKIKDCGIKVPETEFFQVPEIVQRSFWCNDSGLPFEEWNKNIDTWISQELLPVFKKNSIKFLKNGTFSNKFNFVDCISRIDNVKSHLMDINYTSLCFGAGGIDEVVLREVIPYEQRITPCIYNGLPLRSEFRVFYDFDVKKALYVTNYWDYDYCFEDISRNATDKIIFLHEKTRMEDDYNNRKGEVFTLVSDHMKSVELTGKWSVDILLDEFGQFWLIDMAIAQQSAYWDESKCN